MDDIAADAGLAGANINDIGIRLCHRKCPDRRERLAVSDGRPRDAGVVGLPDSASDRAEVIEGRIAGDAGHAADPAASKRTDQPVAEGAEPSRVER